MKWGNLTKEQIEEIIEGAGEKKSVEFSLSFPFIHRFTWVFGGHCGLCGKWNWQWTEKFSILGSTYACKECQKVE